MRCVEVGDRRALSRVKAVNNNFCKLGRALHLFLPSRPRFCSLVAAVLRRMSDDYICHLESWVHLRLPARIGSTCGDALLPASAELLGSPSQ